MSSNAIFNGMGKIQFFDEYPVTSINGAGATTWKPANTNHYGEGDLEVVSSNTRISYCALSAYVDPTGVGNITTALNKQPTRITISAADPGGGIPVYYLPYALNHNRRMTLTDKQGVGGVAFFLTDLVDGCSVYVEGTQANPSVYHINANRQLPHGMASFPGPTASR